MSEFDFHSEVQKVGLVMGFLSDVDLAGIRKAVSDAHTVGWFLDPTRYRDALQRGDMDAMAELAAALEPAVEVWREKIAPKLGAPA